MAVKQGVEDFFDRWFKSEKVEVRKDPVKGRYLVAKTNISGGQNFFNCPPFACAVHEKAKDYVCQHCFNDKKRESEDTHWEHWCSICKQIWYCSVECKRADAKVHLSAECAAMQKLNSDEFDPDIMTEVRLLLRVMGKIAPRESMPEEEKLSSFYEFKADQPFEIPPSSFMIPPPKSLRGNFSIKALEFWQLISNSQALVKNGTIEGLTGVVEYAISLLPEEARLSKEDTMEYYCKIRCNMFGVGGTENEDLVGYGVYVEASFFNHSCEPNVSLSRDFRSLVHQFYMLKDIPAGTELNISYIDDLTKNTEYRRNHLKDNYFFHCVCKRCELPEDKIPEFICGQEECKGFLVPKEKKAKKKAKVLKVRVCNVCFRQET